MTGSSDRGQAYTLEALIAALLLVTAVLFAMQSVVITPTSAGQDRDVSAQQHQMASDALSTAANDGELSRLVRFWDCSDGGFSHGTFISGSPADQWMETEGYPSDLAPIEDVGETLNYTFDAGTRYNLELVYTNASGGQEVSRIVYQGTPGDDVVTASHTVAITEGQQVTGRAEDSETVGGCDDPAIPEAGSGPVHNVVEVRLVLW